jgi:hypothetical protein
MHSTKRPEARPESLWIEADWPAPPGVRAGTTTRLGGVSNAPFDSFNLADHVGDNDASVVENRRRLAELLQMPSDPVWLRQRHGADIIDAAADRGRGADGAYACERGVVCAVLTADCIPLLLADDAGSEIAAVHVGWRGLIRGIAAAALACFRAPPSQLVAWVGPHIGAASYEVGADVRDACLASIPGAEQAFAGAGPRWNTDLPCMLRLQLRERGLRRVFESGSCTYSDRVRFFSHRRDGITGRMASLIWLEPGPRRPQSRGGRREGSRAARDGNT